jgi:hypothetical protein
MLRHTHGLCVYRLGLALMLLPKTDATMSCAILSRSYCPYSALTRLRRLAASIAAPAGSQQDELLQEASALSRSLYRLCFRSIRLLRHANDHDEMEFQKRQDKRQIDLNRTLDDPRLSMLSMLPPVDRPDELRSRVEYYQQYTRENFVQESDYLSQHEEKLQPGHFDRFVYLLRRGNEHRQWLLGDMKFDDPYADKGQDFLSRVDEFRTKALEMIQQSKGWTSDVDEKSQDETDADDDGFWDEDEDDDDEQHSPGLPEWYKNPR